MVNNSRLHHLSYVVEASNLCAMVELFEQSKAPIRGKFGVPYYQGQRYLLVQTTQSSSLPINQCIITVDISN